MNPVAVLINKAMIELPPRFAGLWPVNPETKKELGNDREWTGSSGLAEDVRYYGQWMKKEAFRRIGHLYPKVRLPDEQGGGEATVIAWIWARTVKCPNPACGCQAPLVGSFWLSKKKGHEAWVETTFDGNEPVFFVHNTGKPSHDGTVNRKGGTCISCGTPIPFNYIREQSRETGLQPRLMAVVAQGESGRIYLSPDCVQGNVVHVEKPDDYPDANLPNNPRNFNTPMYGITTFSDLFSNRQLVALTTFSDLVKEAQEQAYRDAVDAGLADDTISLEDGGNGALAYGQAVGTYLAFVVDKLADYNSSICSWDNTREKIRNTFARQAIPMVWDYAEANPFSNSSGCFDNMLEWVYKSTLALPATSRGYAKQHDAQSDCGIRGAVVSSDPPYYDNIGYADLSDYFYVWLRRSLRRTWPRLFATMLVPKAEELVATPYRFDNDKKKARDFFEQGMLQACRRMRECARDDVPVTIYYAYKQSETSEDGGNASTGWETMLSAIIEAGLSITGTWPMRTELGNRTNAMNANALASSIVLVCRKRQADAPVCTRRDFLTALRREMRPALETLRQTNIAPVDLAQASIGPGMAVYSRFSKVLEPDGTVMPVRRALHIINQELDAFVAAQDGDMDEASRFCLDLYRQKGFNDIAFGEAEVLTKARNTSIDALVELGMVHAAKGSVHLVEREKLAEPGRQSARHLWLLTQQVARAMQKDGVEGCASLLASFTQDKVGAVKNLAYRLFTVADQKGWSQEAFVYNALVVHWQDIQSRMLDLKDPSRLREGRLV